MNLTLNAANPIPFVMVDASGVEVAGLGTALTVTVSKNGGSFGASAGTKAELANGWYRYTTTAGECDTAGLLALKVTGAGCLQQNLLFQLPAAATVDPLLRAVPGTYAAGTAGAALGTIGSGLATVTTPIVGTTLSITSGSPVAVTVTGMTISASWTGMDFSLKHSLDDADSAAVLRVRVSNAAVPTTDGALVVEGVAATAAQRVLASLTVTQAAGTCVIALGATLTNALAPAAALVWDLKEFTASAWTNGAIRASGTATVAYAVTRAII